MLGKDLDKDSGKVTIANAVRLSSPRPPISEPILRGIAC